MYYLITTRTNIFFAIYYTYIFKIIFSNISKIFKTFIYFYFFFFHFLSS